MTPSQGIPIDLIMALSSVAQGISTGAYPVTILPAKTTGAHRVKRWKSGFVKTIGDVYSRLFIRARKNSKTVSMVLYCAAALIGGFVTVSLIGHHSSRSHSDLVIMNEGLNKKEQGKVSEFKTFFKANKLDSAFVRVEALLDKKEVSAQAWFMYGLIACRKKNYAEALDAFDQVLLFPAGKKLFEKNSSYLVERFMNTLSKMRAGDELISLLSRYFRAADNPLIVRALQSEKYHLRWNALRILQAAGKKVDLITVFMLDLKYGPDEQTRLQAVHDLGESKDKRAIPALRAACLKTRDDPVVSYSASKVLVDVFAVRIPERH